MSDWFRSHGFSDVHEQLIIGALPLDEADVRMLSALGVTRVLNLVEDREYQLGARKRVVRALEQAEIAETRLSSEDYGGLRPELLEQAAAQVNAWLDQGERVYLHCRAGWQRSAAVAGAVLCVRLQIDPDEALRRIRLRKPTAAPLEHQREDLRAWWRARVVQSLSD